MSSRNRFWSAVLGGLVVCVFAASAEAQRGRPAAPGPGFQGPGAPGAPKKEPEPFNGKGTVDQVMQQKTDLYIKMTNASNETWYLKCAKGCKVRVVGTATPDFLRPGLFGQFNALVDKKAIKIKDPVKKLTLFTPSQEYTPGIFPDAAGGAAEAGDFKPYVVAGAITMSKGGDITMAVPNLSPRLKVDLADDVQIDFVIEDWRMIAQGDALTATGTKMDMAQMMPQPPPRGPAPRGPAPRGPQPPGPGFQGGGFQGGAAGAQPGAPGAAPGGAPPAAGEKPAMNLANCREVKITKAEPLSSASPAKPGRGASTAKSAAGKKEKDPDSAPPEEKTEKPKKPSKKDAAEK